MAMPSLCRSGLSLDFHPIVFWRMKKKKDPDFYFTVSSRIGQTDDYRQDWEEVGYMQTEK